MPSGYGASPPPNPGPVEPVPVFDLIGIVLGVLSFIWGFLDWYGTTADSFTYKGFATTGAGAIGLCVLAAAAAGFELLRHDAPASVVPAAASVAAVVVTVGLFIGKPSGEDAKIGLVLQLITALFQAAMFVLGFLQARGRNVGARESSPASLWGSGPGSGPATYTEGDLPSQPLPSWPGGYPSGGAPPPSYLPPSPATQSGYPGPPQGPTSYPSTPYSSGSSQPTPRGPYTPPPARNQPPSPPPDYQPPPPYRR